MNRTEKFKKQSIEFCKNMGSLIQLKRVSLGISQKEVSEHIGISQSTYSLFERGLNDSLSIYFLTMDYLSDIQWEWTMDYKGIYQ